MKHFIISIPDAVLQDAKEVAESRDDSDEYFLQRVIETMSASVGRPGCDYTDIGVEAVGRLHYLMKRCLNYDELMEICPDLSPQDMELFGRILEQLEGL